MDRMGGQPLCMFTYSRMFNSCQIPGEDCDSIERFEGARHAVVLCNDAIFAFDVLDEAGEIYPTGFFIR